MGRHLEGGRGRGLGLPRPSSVGAALAGLPEGGCGGGGGGQAPWREDKPPLQVDPQPPSSPFLLSCPLGSLGLVDVDTSGPSRSLCRVRAPEGTRGPSLDHRLFNWESRE